MQSLRNRDNTRSSLNLFPFSIYHFSADVFPVMTGMKLPRVFCNFISLQCLLWIIHNLLCKSILVMREFRGNEPKSHVTSTRSPLLPHYGLTDLILSTVAIYGTCTSGFLDSMSSHLFDRKCLLIKQRRGHACNLGSKMRTKLYTSDLNSG